VVACSYVSVVVVACSYVSVVVVACSYVSVVVVACSYVYAGLASKFCLMDSESGPNLSPRSIFG
jgi:hypothetical protein